MAYTKKMSYNNIKKIKKKLKIIGINMLSRVKNKEDIKNLFEKNPDNIKYLVSKYIKEAQEKIEEIINLHTTKRTFENTCRALDHVWALSNISILFNSLSALEMLSPKKEIREHAQKEILNIQAFWVEQISNNAKLYKAFKDYAENKSKKENLTKKEKYFISGIIDDYKRSGLDLPKDALEKVKKLNKELGQLGLEFESNIATGQSSIQVEEKDLEGLDKTFIDALKKTDDETFILGVDYPTYFNIMDNCSIENTRKRLYLAFNNRAYPENNAILKKIIKKRAELATMLGFTSYAHLDLDDQMAKTPETAKKFLTNLYEKASIKAQREFETLASNLPSSTTLTKDNRIKAWDARYIKNQYKKKNLHINEQKIAEYFPAEKTIQELLAIYEQFLSLRFEISDISGLWHEDTKLIETYSQKDNKLLGYLIVDLHPRENKYSHACQMTIIPAVKDNGPCVCIVVANFPKSIDNKPSLLQLQDVETFFHELGHALHAILGRTAIASFAGTNVKTDFVEMPSQMLEEWLSDKNILQKISNHYKSGEPLPEDIIKNILKLKQFDTGDFLQRQCYLSYLALAYFDAGEDKNPKEIYQKITNTMRKYNKYDKNDNMYASFGHLSGYGAKYYGYMWSKVYAIDMFSKIKEHGLLDPEIGQKYIDCVISQGGSQDPNTLLKDFLEREPRQDAFLKYMGISG